MKKISLENVKANASFGTEISLENRKCHGARCNKMYVHHLQGTNLWHMFCWHFKNNFCKMPRVLNPQAFRFGKQEKGLQFCCQISVNVLHVDGICVITLLFQDYFHH